jgi:hypothetical protein
LKDCRFPDYPGRTVLVSKKYLTKDGGYNTSIMNLDLLRVINFNGVEGDTFDVFYAEQRGDFVVPIHDPKEKPGTDRRQPKFFTGAVEADLTNEKHREKHRTCVGGVIAPKDAKPRPGVVGLVKAVEETP